MVSNRTDTPTVPPKQHRCEEEEEELEAKISSHTRIATVCALARLGCVTRTIFSPGMVHFAFLKYWQICVVFPHPVWPIIITT
tara:strand:- start:20 stop:268 length:249 start_codon:yes stop_codon:yes gene_type:complete